MTAYIVRRLIQSLIIVIVVSILIFLMMRLLPGDPVLMYLNQSQLHSLSQEKLDLMKQEFGLDKPLPMQYLNWVGSLFHGDLGTSLSYQKSVNVLIAQRLPVTLYLGVISFILGNFLGLLIGVISAVRRGKMMDTIATLIANIGITIPVFWLAIILIYIFGLTLRWLPTHGFTSPFENFWLSTKMIILPVICMSVFTVGGVARQTRSSLLEVLSQDYIRTAWAKGLKESVIIIRHVLKNSLIPVVTLSGMQVAYIFGGAVLIETVFNIAGIGRLSVDALLGLDYAVVQAVTLLLASMVVLVNLLVDIFYGWLDPRIRFT